MPAEATTDVYAPSKTTAADVAAEAKLREQVRICPRHAPDHLRRMRWLRRLARR